MHYYSRQPARVGRTVPQTPLLATKYCFDAVQFTTLPCQADL